MRVVYLPLGDQKAATAVGRQLKAAGADNHPVLKDLSFYVFWSAHVWVAYEGDAPVSIHCTKLGKRKKNVWEPYANWYGAYTLPSERRKGHATALYRVMEAAAVQAGCRRVKSLAGSSAGLALHHSLRHACWGLTPNNEVWVDSALPGHEGSYVGLGAPPQAPGELMSNSAMKQQIKKGLRYDHAT